MFGDYFSYGNSSLIDAGEFVRKLLEKCLESVPHKYNAFRNNILNLSRCNYCNDVRGNIENLNIIRVNVFNINQGSISLFSLLYPYFMCESFSRVVSKCPNEYNNDINQSGKDLLNASPVFIVQTDRVNQNSSLVHKTELDIPLTLDLSSFIACDLKDDGISSLYRLISCITYQGAIIKTGHYVCYNIHEDGVTKFNDDRIEYFSSLNEDAMVKNNTHILFYIRSDKLSMVHTNFSALDNVDEVSIKNMLKILFENTEIPFCQKIDIEKCIYNKINDEIVNSYFKLLESRKTDVISFVHLNFVICANQKYHLCLKGT